MSLPPCCRPAKSECQFGFTLIEVLLAVAILGTIATLLFVSLSSSLNTMDTVREHAARDEVARTCLRLLAEELANGYAHASSPWMGQDGQLSGYAADTVAFLSISQFPVIEQARESDMTRVLYTRDGNRLIRLARRNLYETTDDSLEQQELAVDVEAFNLRYYDSLAKVWVDEWDGRTRKTQPGAVLIEITFRRTDSEPRLFREWVTVGAQL
ncbi:MAG: type II secretion system protein GspJ [Nitrospiraceae bacterium]